MNEPSQRRSSSKQIAGGSQQDIAKLAGPAEPIVSEIPFDQDHGQTSRHESEIPMDVDPYDPKNESDDTTTMITTMMITMMSMINLNKSSKSL